MMEWWIAFGVRALYDVATWTAAFLVLRKLGYTVYIERTPRPRK